MGKFFLPDNKGHKDKPVNYKITIYKQLLELMRNQHLNHIHHIIKALKDTQQEGNPQKQAELQKQLNEAKLLKKREWKLIVFYIMIKFLEIPAVKNLEKLAALPIDEQKIIDEVSNSDALKQFMDKVMQSSIFKKKMEQFAESIVIVKEKKTINKEKNKQRKAKKLEVRRQLNKSNHSESLAQESELQVEESAMLGEQNQSEDMVDEKDQPTKQNNNKAENNFAKDQQAQNNEEVGQKKAKADFWKRNSQKAAKKNNQVAPKKENQQEKLAALQQKVTRKPQQKPVDEQKQQRINFWNRNKERALQKQQASQQHSSMPRKMSEEPEKKGRTDFKKTGRNKVLHEKKIKKQFGHKKQFSHKGKHQDAKPDSKKQQNKKPWVHPSWEAKQQEKSMAAITPFQGKRVLL